MGSELRQPARDLLAVRVVFASKLLLESRFLLGENEQMEREPEEPRVAGERTGSERYGLPDDDSRTPMYIGLPRQGSSPSTISFSVGAMGAGVRRP